MMSARNAAIVVLPSCSAMVALISQMHRTDSRHGPAATTEACANAATRSTNELLRYRRSSANPIPAMSRLPLKPTLGLCVAILPIDRRVGRVDVIEIVVPLDPLLHREAEPP